MNGGVKDYVVRLARGNVHSSRRVLVLRLRWLDRRRLLFGLAPAIRVSATDPQSTLRQGGRTGDLRRARGRNVLVGGEIALAMVLVTGAGLVVGHRGGGERRFRF